jgi:Ca-activated chloride channel family protein
MQIDFANIWVLYLLWVVPAAGLWWFALCRRREAGLAAFASPQMQARIRPPYDANRTIWQSLLTGCAALLLLLAAARPRWGEREETVYTRGRDLIIALDVSLSMLANDVHPNRLERAKADIVDLVKDLTGDRAGLLAFRKKANLICPLTTDYAYLIQALNAAGPGSAPRGETDIGNAITRALEAFDTKTASHKAVILISDGEDLTGTAEDTARSAAEHGIPIFTVGLGARGGARIPVPETGGFMEYDGKPVVTKQHHDTLYKIARITGGAYIPMETAGAGSVTLGTLYRKHLRNIDARDQEESLRRHRIERYQWFLCPAILLLLAAACLSRGRLAAGPRPPLNKTGPNAAPLPEGPTLKDLTPPARPVRHLALCLAAWIIAGHAVASTNALPQAGTPDGEPIPPGRAGAWVAQGLYRAGRYREAAEAYLDSAAGASRHAQGDYRYNAAVSHFKAGEYRKAADLLRALALQTEGDLSKRAALGLGASLYNQTDQLAGEESRARTRHELLTQAGEAFKDAFRGGTDATPAGRNLSVILKQLPESRQLAQIEELTEQYGQQPPDQIAMDMLKAQRAINQGISRACQDPTPASVDQLETLAEQQRNNAARWIPLKGKLLGALAQEATDDAARQRLQAAEQHVELLRNTMLDAADDLRDLDLRAEQRARTAQYGLYQLWKGVAPYEPLLAEDLRLQTNALLAAQAASNRASAPQEDLLSDQQECAELTQLFRTRFEAAVPADGLPAQPDAASAQADPTNAAMELAITPETRLQIIDLADQALAAQEKAAELLRNDADRPGGITQQKVAVQALDKIRELLPKQQAPQQQQPPQEQPQREPQQQQQKPDDSQNTPQDDAGEPQAKPVPEDVQELLQKALQREREHKAEKERRDRRIPMSPANRDW